MNWCVQHRWITIGLTVGTLVLGVVGMGKVQNQFFPDSSRPEILVELWFPEGTSFAANEEVAERVERRLQQEAGVETVTTWIGSGVPRFYLPLDQVPAEHRPYIRSVPRNLRHSLHRAGRCGVRHDQVCPCVAHLIAPLPLAAPTVFPPASPPVITAPELRNSRLMKFRLFNGRSTTCRELIV